MICSKEFVVKETYDVDIKLDENGKKIINSYKKIKTLGRGSFSKVILMEDINTNIQYAVKVIDKKALEKRQRGFKKDSEGNLMLNPSLQNALREIAILKKLNNPHIIKLSEILHDDEFGKIYMVLELCNRGPLMKYHEFSGEFSINDYYIKENKHKFDYSEEELRDFVRGIVIGLEYLHANNIVHRDIKPDNILLTENGEAKITDFNVSKTLEGEDDKKDKETEGTVYFMAPEMCEGKIVFTLENSKKFAGKPLDIWALGVTLFILTYKDLPFKPENPDNIIQLLDIISNAELKFPESRHVSDELMDLMSKMFERDPLSRITINEIKDHTWINLDRVPLANITKNNIQKIEVTELDLKSCLDFFSIMNKTKKLGNLWKRKSLLKNITSQVKVVEFD